MRDENPLFHHARVTIRDANPAACDVRALFSLAESSGRDVRLPVCQALEPLHNERRTLRDVTLRFHDERRPEHDVEPFLQGERTIPHDEPVRGRNERSHGSRESEAERRIREAFRDEFTFLVFLGLTNSHESTTLSPEMKVIGMKDPLRSEALRHFGWDFRAWLTEVERIDWPGWPELLEFYPQAERTGKDRAHFPLAADGSGITADVFFGQMPFIQLQEVVLLAPMPQSPDKSAASIHSH